MKPSVDEKAIWKPLAWFKPYKGNPKDHPADQVKSLRELMDADTGQTLPVIADESGELIAGHGRLLAAQLDPPWKKLKVIIAHGWTPEQKRAYRIADNKISELATWNEEALRTELRGLKAAGFDLKLTAFTLPAIDQWLGNIAALGAMPALPTGDKSPFEQITFTLHTSQVKIVRQAMKVADALGDYGGSPNDNKNGNAIARVASMFLKQKKFEDVKRKGKSHGRKTRTPRKR